MIDAAPRQSTGGKGERETPRRSAGGKGQRETPRATIRPAHVRAPEHWQRDDGPPEPRAVTFIPQEVKGMPDPVRYGDWERKGLAIDF